MWDLNSPTRDRTRLPALQGRLLNTGSLGESHGRHSQHSDSIDKEAAAQGNLVTCPWRRAMPKNGQTTLQLHSFYVLERIYSKSFKLAFSKNFQMQAGFRKSRGPRDRIANICWIMEEGKEISENIYCFIDYAKAFDCVDHNKLWKILEEMGIPDHLSCLLRNPYAGQEAVVRTRYGTTDWFKIGKGVHQGCILSPCLFNL